MDESSDILGGTLPITHGKRPSFWSQQSLFTQAALVFAGLLLAYSIGGRLKAWIKQLQERRYRMTMRRRHGIPDNDHRPFNVAYAAALRREEREAAGRSGRNVEREQSLSRGQRNAAPDLANVRQRSLAGLRNPDATWLSHNSSSNFVAPGHYPLDSANIGGPSLGAFEAHGRAPIPSDPLNFSDRYNPNPPSINAVRSDNLPTTMPQTISPSRHSSRKNLNTKGKGNLNNGKRALEEGIEQSDHAKKTRVEGDELIDGDENAEWDASRNRRDHTGPKRGSKRSTRDEDDDVVETKYIRDKRARKVSIDRVPQEIPGGDATSPDADKEIEVDEDEDELTELRSIPRGKKRDRAEAGSTFGGDDEDSFEDGISGSGGKTRRRRKRRTVSKRKSDVTSRGKKRDRDAEESDPEDAVDPSKPQVSRKKRGKKADSDESMEDGEALHNGSDVSMDDVQISADPLCKGRRIGEEWESNGVQFKVGPNGDRLRQALVKKARSKFVMPKDSQHPDREANMEVYVETWLTEDEYNDAKDRQALAWQDSPKASVEPETPGNVPDSPITKVGKNLLWESSKSETSPLAHVRPLSRLNPNTSVSTPPKPNAYRQSIATNLGIRAHLNPVQKSQSMTNKRVASPAAENGAVTPGSRRTFSKWEKQDLEAEAMRKMRVKAEEAKQKEEKEKAKTAAVTLGALGSGGVVPSAPVTTSTSKPTLFPAATTPTATPLPPFSFAKSEVKPGPVENKPPTINFTVPSVTNGATKASTLPADTSKPPVAVSFSLPGSSAPQTSSFAPPGAPLSASNESKPTTVTSNLFSAPSSSSSAPFSFNKPSVPAFASASSNPATTNTAGAVPSNPSSGFTAPSSSNTTNTATNTVPKFSFGPVSQPIKVNNPSTTSAFGTEQKKSETGSSTQGQTSLLSRLGGFTPDAQASSLSTSTQSQPHSSQAKLGPSFSFAKPTEVPKVSVFGGSTTPQSALSTGIAASTTLTAPTTTANSGLKFNFGFSSKPTTPAPGSSSATAPMDPPKPANATPASFGFNTSNSQSAQPAPAATSTPTFNFSAPANGTSSFGKTGFGSTNPFPSSSNSFSPTPGGPSPFGASSGGNAFAGPSAVGASNSSSGSMPKFTFGITPSTSTATNKPTEDSKPSFSFGTPTPAFGSSEAPKSAFSFSNQSSSTPAAAPPGGSAFSFGNPPASSTTPQSSPFGAQQPIFGAKPGSAGPSAFGFAAPTTPSFGFGTPPQNQQQ